MTKSLDDMKEFLLEVEDISKDMAALLMSRTKGKGALIVGVMASIMASLEHQHKGTIGDITTGALLMGKLDDSLDEHEPASNSIN